MLVDLIAARSDTIEPVVVSLRDQRTRGFMERLRESGADVTSLGLRRSDPLALFRLSTRLTTGAYDIVHAHLDYSTTAGIAAVLLRRSMRPAIVCHLHNDPWRQNRQPHRLVSRFLARHVDAYIVPTPTIEVAVRRLVGGRARRLSCIPPGVDGDYFDAERHKTARDSPYRAGSRRVIGFVGRLAVQKRVDVLLAAMPRLLQREPATRLLVVGAGPLRAPLLVQSRALEIESAVRLVDPVEQIAPIYLAMDVLCLPSDFEGFGLVLIEAMALGVPVVATDVIGIRDVIEHERNGLLVPANDPEAMAAAITRIFDDESLRDRLRAAALDDVRRRFLRSRMAGRIETLYREALARRSRHL